MGQIRQAELLVELSLKRLVCPNLCRDSAPAVCYLTALFHMERIFVVSIVLLLVTAFLLPRQTHSYRIIVTDNSYLSGDDERSSSRSQDVVVNCQRGDLFAGSCVDQTKVKVTTEVIYNSDDISCTNTQLEATDCSTDEVELCYNLSTSHWYGGE